MAILVELSAGQHVSLAAPSDLLAIVQIYNQSIDSKVATADLRPVMVAMRQKWFDTHAGDSKRPIYVVKNEAGALMAWGSFSNLYDRPAYHISSEISIYVATEYQRQGLAKRLATWMLTQAPQLGINNVVALVFGHNMASLALFAQLGFSEWGRMPQVCDMEGFIADVIMLGKAVHPANH